MSERGAGGAGATARPTRNLLAPWRWPVARLRSATRELATRDAVVGAGLLMVVGQLAFRAWALYPSWFYLDDYSLLLDATRQDQPTAGYLLEPWNSHLMPGGRLVAWLVAHSGTLNWQLAATLTLALQLVGSLAALWMLVTLFGRRWAILAPLGLYLTSAMTIPALMWWTACLNQLAMQAGFFIAVGAWVRHLRGGGLHLALLAYGGVTLGLLFDVKALLILPVLGFLAVAYFASGGPVQRVRGVLRGYWRAALLGLVPAVAYAAYYASHVSQPFEHADAELAGTLAESMLGTAFVSAAVGGPWRWEALAPPNSFADPPGWAVQVAWVTAALVLLYAALRRKRTGRAWALLTGYLSVLLALLLTSRAPVYGDLIGLEYRYVTDAACVLALCVGLAFLELRGATESSTPREDPVLRWSAPPWLTTTLVVAICASGLASSVGAVDQWHHDNASDPYVHTLQQDLATYGAVDLVDAPAPDEVYSAIFAPDNQLSRLTPLLSSRVSYPTSSDRLVVVAPDGGLRFAQIESGTRAVAGPVEGCGWVADDDGLTVPLSGTAFRWTWWLRIGYFANRDSPVVVTAGDSRVETHLQQGLNSLFVAVEGTFSTVRIDGLSAGTTACVDTVEVGQPIPGAPLS